MDDSATIEGKIPHRPPFLFIDRVVERTPGGLVAEREVRADEPHFAGHYPGNPIMPGVLICEAAFQAGAVHLADRLADEGGGLGSGTPVLSRIVEAKFRAIVRPGDRLRIEITYKERVSRFHFLDAVIRVGDGKVATVSFALAVV